MKDLAALMARYVAGDTQAFEELYQATAPSLLSYLTRMAGRRDVAEDVLQETFIKVHRARASYVAGANPTPWLYAIAHRAYLDHFRKARRRRERVEQAVKEADTSAHLTGVPSSEFRAPDPEAQDAIHRALSTLPDNQRQAVVLTKLEGKSLSDAADIAETSVGAMKLRVHRGMTKLKKFLASNE